MALESGQVFAVMQVAYRQGVLDRFNPLLGEALDGAMEETGFNLDDLFNQMDGAREETVEKLDRTILSSGFILRIAASDRLMRLCARLIDNERIRRVMVRVMQDFFVVKISPAKAGQFSVTKRLKGYLASFMGMNGPRTD